LIQTKKVSTRFIASGLLAGLFLLALPACGLLGGGGEEGGESTENQEGTPSPQDQIDELLDRLQTQRTIVSSLEAELTKANADLETLKSGGTLGEQPRPEISLERARLEVIRHAQANTDIYGPDLADKPLVWEVESAEEGEEFFYINLAFRPAGRFEGTPGTEQFIVDRTGLIEFRQVLLPPQEAPPATPVPAP